MKKNLTFLAFAVALLGMSCGPDDNERREPKLTVSPSELRFAASGNAVQTVSVTAENVGWQVSIPDESKAWIFVTEGEDDATLVVSVQDHEGEDPRTGSFSIVPDNDKVEPKRVVVSQEGAEIGDLSFAIAPDELTFDGADAPAQEVTVTVSHAKLTWKAAAKEDWIEVTAEGDKLSVAVADNPESEERVGMVIVTPDNGEVQPKAVRVTQKGRLLPPSLGISVESGRMEFGYTVVGGTAVYVTAVDVEWDAVVSDTPGEVGGEVEWLKVTGIVKDSETPYFIVKPDNNPTTEERTAYVVVTSDNPEVPALTVTVVQAGRKRFLSTLASSVAIEDMTEGVHCSVDFYPNQQWMDRPVAYWYVTLWASGVSQTQDFYGYEHYAGVGTKLYLEFYSERIPFNDDGEYYLPEGEYTVAADPVDDDGYPTDWLPFTVKPGREVAGGVTILDGSWYQEVIGGSEADVYGGEAPITGGTVTVARSGDEYTLELVLKDDADHDITGTCVARFDDNMRVIFHELPESNPGDGDGELLSF